MRPFDLERYLIKRRSEFAERHGISIDKLGDEEGVWFGDRDVEISGILVTWMSTKSAIEKAVSEECNLILCHEVPFFGSGWRSQDSDAPDWRVNVIRKKALSDNKITVFQSHATLDEILITDSFSEILGLPKAVIQPWRLQSIHEIEETPLKLLACEIKEKMGLQVMRVVGNLDRKVKRIGLAYGGIGLFVNLSFWEQMLQWNPEVIIAGETDEYAMRYAIDNNICVIETSHPLSENPGLEKFSEELKTAFPEIKTVFYRCGIPWSYV